MRRWLLPESIEDILPPEARRIERLRRALLDEFALHGYELVMPPLLEYVESLLTGSGHDMDLRTFKLVDQLSGRTMGIRADITPQVARIDAHLLNRKGVARLCYCGSVLHTLPSGLTATREPLQLGAELYGHAGIEADVEVIRLLAQALEIAGVRASRIDLGHVGVFRALSARGGIEAELEQELFAVLQAKDMPDLRELVRDVPEPVRSALLALPECYGGAEALEQALKLVPDDAEIVQAVGDLRKLADELADLPVSFDLADLRGYHYHSGVVFAAYCAGHPGAVALGGRYDKVGKAFGRGRPATGFSLDLRELCQLEPLPKGTRAILAPASGDGALREAVLALRARGEIVIEALPGHEGTWGEAGCDRRLAQRDGKWIVENIQGEI
ncbi:MAG: ATP phosphoribosyltransferase regulatory subunit [Rhodocyclaceae bacterium]|nr:MAG: ATP phosphoribosyltransferase regulatory subunit [Rhodocyclaceae bacterium]MBE7421567.1 ATP phosphoribosyltransferase regulatory subunit [Zoogloeaceae bacterium]MBV6408763.1 ATP phosphoribosyltransferase regulatory subunit [Rhodocyclaceae bacterium]MCK6385444.1 ATP phosphoribosyltransferase regulatory subunit [Rhodocyclaceae bacterium]CAG0932671.1 ATP phosphoribosyltransferase regulatory subunit [Rhodocyclaceae bacterium]